MRRRGAGGVGAIHKQQLAQARFKDKGTEMADDQLQQMTKQMETFRSNLQDFAGKYKNKIKKNPQFRQQFQKMCSASGVDPLASSKGFWANMLGVGDFYYELGVQIVEVCLATKHRNGGILKLEDLRKLLVKSRSVKQEEIDYDDLLRAIEKLKILGEGFRTIATGSTKDYIVQSVPAELSGDHTKIIQRASDNGYVTLTILVENFTWEEMRAEKAINDLIREGLVWIDEQFEGEPSYWFPGLQKL
ncbi:vacuolar-sorting protein SNF8 [Parasteatoda tepidariorum]|uniref:vacuolar-sorting protein SNF8 n=1 Tax=Parasteatoda tepidariorum TaxID=114398 RepID=UPI00077FB615|nr:vacuolar-sorting protein SNF8-like [Parasteatoda tepidariorum]